MEDELQSLCKSSSLARVQHIDLLAFELGLAGSNIGVLRLAEGLHGAFVAIAGQPLVWWLLLLREGF